MVSKQFYKNSICGFIGLLLVSISTVIMIQMYFNTDIDDKIQNISVLKDIKYLYWGTNPNPSNSSYYQNFTLYTLQEQDGQIHATKSNISKLFQYHFKYQNVSFTQGDSGRLSFINTWELISKDDNISRQQNIKTINLAADKIFNYDYYSPIQRNIPIIYNETLKMISNEFLVKFYTVYLMRYFFQKSQQVYQTIFSPLNFDQNKSDLIYNHPKYGWKTSDGFMYWVRLSLKGIQYSCLTKQYQDFIVQLNLTQKQISNLIFERSTLYNFIAALNGTIKLKSQSDFGKGSCPDKYCRNQQLAAFQIARSLLTKDSLFSSLSLNVPSKGLNNTLVSDLQYQQFCKDNKDKYVCMLTSSEGTFFTKYFLGDFQQLSFIWNNKANSDTIQNKYNLFPEDSGKSVVGYIQYLYNKVVESYGNDVFSWAHTNYNHIQNIIKNYQKLFITQLYSRALLYRFGNNNETVCKDYFKDNFTIYGDVGCNEVWNFSQLGVRKYIQAYLFVNEMRTNMSNQLLMPHNDIIDFFKNQDKSLLARQLAQIQGLFASSFGCQSSSIGGTCEVQQLLCMQWGQNKVLKNLPKQLFENNISSIIQWDTQNLMNGYNPDYYSVIGKTKTISQCYNMLSSDQNQGIFSLFNLINIATKSKTDMQSSDSIKYVGKIVINIMFKGLLNTVDVDAIFNGFTSDLIQQKRKMSIQGGGAPWMQNELKLIKTDNKIDVHNNQLQQIPQFNVINTGIFNQQKIRQVSKIWGQSTSSSKYTVYRGMKKDEEGYDIPVDLFQKYVTNRKIEGTNLLGFRPFISSGDNLLAYISQAYQSMTLVYDSDISYQDNKQLNNSVNAIKYKIVLKEKKNTYSTFVGLEQLNQNSIDFSSQSFVIVEPVTGLTLQMKFFYTVKTNLLFTNYILPNKTKPVVLYESSIAYTRKNLSQIEQIHKTINERTLYTIISSSLSGVFLVVLVVLIVFYCRNQRKEKEEKDKDGGLSESLKPVEKKGDKIQENYDEE